MKEWDEHIWKCLCLPKILKSHDIQVWHIILILLAFIKKFLSLLKVSVDTWLVNCNNLSLNSLTSHYDYSHWLEHFTNSPMNAKTLSYYNISNTILVNISVVVGLRIRTAHMSPIIWQSFKRIMIWHENKLTFGSAIILQVFRFKGE